MKFQPRQLSILSLLLPALLGSCSPSKEELAAREQAKEIRLKMQYKPIAQAAADAGLISKRACVTLTNEGKLYSTDAVDILPETRLWRFLESQHVAVRQKVIPPDGGMSQTRFFVAERYRDNMPTNTLYCFGKWTVLDVAPVKDAKSTSRNGVDMYPVDVLIRLTNIPTQAWLDSNIIRENLDPSSGMTTLTKNYKLRMLLPQDASQLPPPDNATPLDK